ncbi:hypothetical protein ACO22_07053 [Paracoccidioides brasiliensis]|uniref:Tf2-1-like SH3-like domain-containing protein n=1 Tax=Paracoccidioides brasiliensis TaxID=121759 RepID=A0A1D2J5P8_PARBR|nr:hypothetical protein ACO22_07053 [Paracoccidioides brasiliensis]
MREKIQKQLEKAKSAHKAYYDSKHSAKRFHVGDWVLLNAKNFRMLRPARKLDHKYVGHFQFIESWNTQAYKLSLPRSMRDIYPVFHISLLEQYNIRDYVSGSGNDPGADSYENDCHLADSQGLGTFVQICKGRSPPTEGTGLDFINIKKTARFSEVPEPKALIFPNLSYNDANYAAVKSQFNMQNADFRNKLSAYDCNHPEISSLDQMLLSKPHPGTGELAEWQKKEEIRQKVNKALEDESLKKKMQDAITKSMNSKSNLQIRACIEKSPTSWTKHEAVPLRGLRLNEMRIISKWRNLINRWTV